MPRCEVTIRNASPHDQRTNITIEAPPWGDLEPCDRAETRPSGRTHMKGDRLREHPAIAAIRAEVEAMRRERSGS